MYQAPRAPVYFPLEGLDGIPTVDRIVHVLTKQAGWTQLRAIAALADLEVAQVNRALQHLDGRIQKKKNGDHKGAAMYIRLIDRVTA